MSDKEVQGILPTRFKSGWDKFKPWKTRLQWKLPGVKKKHASADSINVYASVSCQVEVTNCSMQTFNFFIFDLIRHMPNENKDLHRE